MSQYKISPTLDQKEMTVHGKKLVYIFLVSLPLVGYGMYKYDITLSDDFFSIYMSFCMFHILALHCLDLQTYHAMIRLH